MATCDSGSFHYQGRGRRLEVEPSTTTSAATGGEYEDDCGNEGVGEWDDGIQGPSTIPRADAQGARGTKRRVGRCASQKSCVGSGRWRLIAPRWRIDGGSCAVCSHANCGPSTGRCHVQKDMGMINKQTTLHHRSYIRIYCYFKAKNQISNLGLTPFAIKL